MALAGRSLRGSFLAGLVFGVAFFFLMLSWVLNVAWYAWAGLAGGSAVILAVLAIGQRLLLRLPGWPVAVAGWWVASEALRDRWPWGGFPWGRLAMSQADAPTAGWAAVGGAPLLTFLVALAGGTLAWLILACLGRLRGAGTGDPGTVDAGPSPPASRRVQWPRWARWPRWLAGPVLATVAASGLAAAGAALPVDPVAGSPTAVAAAVQGDVPHARNLPQLLNDSVVTQNHAQATGKLARQVRSGQRQRPEHRHLAGEFDQPGPVLLPGRLPGGLGGGQRNRPARPGRGGTEQPAAQRRSALAAGPWSHGHLRQTAACPVR